MCRIIRDFQQLQKTSHFSGRAVVLNFIIVSNLSDSGALVLVWKAVFNIR